MTRSLKTKRDLVAELGGFGLKVYGTQTFSVLPGEENLDLKLLRHDIFNHVTSIPPDLVQFVISVKTFTILVRTFFVCRYLLQNCSEIEIILIT